MFDRLKIWVFISYSILWFLQNTYYFRAMLYENLSILVVFCKCACAAILVSFVVLKIKSWNQLTFVIPYHLWHWWWPFSAIIHFIVDWVHFQWDSFSSVLHLTVLWLIFHALALFRVFLDWMVLMEMKERLAPQDHLDHQEAM